MSLSTRSPSFSFFVCFIVLPDFNPSLADHSLGCNATETRCHLTDGNVDKSSTTSCSLLPPQPDQPGEEANVFVQLLRYHFSGTRQTNMWDVKGGEKIKLLHDDANLAMVRRCSDGCLLLLLLVVYFAIG